MAVLVVSSWVYGDSHILIIGTEYDSTGRDSEKPTLPPFSSKKMGQELKHILEGASLGKIRVQVEDRYDVHKTGVGDCESHCYSLAQWFHYPYPADVEVTHRWPNLRGENGVKWDYVIVIGDRGTMTFAPGMYAYGVSAIAQEVAKGSGELVLLSSWPSKESKVSLDHYQELVGRVAQSGGYQVAPVGHVWSEALNKDRDLQPKTVHDMAYLVAATLYSKLWGQSAETSTYKYNQSLAAIAHSVVEGDKKLKAYQRKPSSPTPFLLRGDTRRMIHYSEKGTSTEEGFKKTVKLAMKRARVNYDDANSDKYTDEIPVDDDKGWSEKIPSPLAWNHGRSHGHKKYVVNPIYWDLSFGYVYHWNSWGHPVPKQNDHHVALIDNHDLRLSQSMYDFAPQGARALPVRTLWAQLHKAYPDLLPQRDGWGPHLGYEVDHAVGTFMYTLFSGRCPLEPEPEEMTHFWHAQKIGYETAWKMGQRQVRAPGFQVLPSASDALTLRPNATETMQVRFYMKPQSPVSVKVSIPSSVALLSPQSLTFTPENYNIPQEVNLTVIPGEKSLEAFSVAFLTKSQDMVYDGLSDSWTYTVERSEVSKLSRDRQDFNETTFVGYSKTILLGDRDAQSENTVISKPSHGSVIWADESVIYTPHDGFIGVDVFGYATTTGKSQAFGYITVEVKEGIPEGWVSIFTDRKVTDEMDRIPITFTFQRTGDVSRELSVSFGNTGQAHLGKDYTLSAKSPMTFRTGKSSMSLILTPIDDTEFGERSESVRLMIVPGSNYVVGKGMGEIIIHDNDNRPPEAEAGVDRKLILAEENLWSPTKLKPAAWYDAKDKSSISLNGDQVVEWADKSGHHHHASQSHDKKRPLYIAHDERAGGQPSMLTAKSIEKGGFELPKFSVKRWYMVTGYGKGEEAVFDVRSALLSGVVRHHEIIGRKKHASFGSEEETIRVNGVDILASKVLPMPLSVCQFDLDATQKWLVGYGLSKSRNSWDGPLCELIATDGSESEEMRAVIEGYLAHKWETAERLPEEHPFRSFPPRVIDLYGKVNDADGDRLSTLWTLKKGPGKVVFSDPNHAETTVVVFAKGEYIFDLKVDDVNLQQVDELRLSVE